MRRGGRDAQDRGQPPMSQSIEWRCVPLRRGARVEEERGHLQEVRQQLHVGLAPAALGVGRERLLEGEAEQQQPQVVGDEPAARRGAQTRPSARRYAASEPPERRGGATGMDRGLPSLLTCDLGDLRSQSFLWQQRIWPPRQETAKERTSHACRIRPPTTLAFVCRAFRPQHGAPRKSATS